MPTALCTSCPVIWGMAHAGAAARIRPRMVEHAADHHGGEPEQAEDGVEVFGSQFWSAWVSSVPPSPAMADEMPNTKSFDVRRSMPMLDAAVCESPHGGQHPAQAARP